MEHSFGRLSATLSDHFGMDECRKLCLYFDLLPAQRSDILKGKSPGVTLLEHLGEDDIIVPGDFSKLEKALKELKCASAAVKEIEEYHQAVGIANNEIYYELDSDSDTEERNNDANPKTKETFENFLVKVGLDGKLADKLSLDDFVVIMDPSSSASATYPLLFWQKLTSFDYRACLPDLSAKDRFSVRDFIYAMILCSDNFLRQDIIAKMSSCQMAVPVLLPTASSCKVQFLIWALRGIIKQSSADLEQYIVYCPSYTVSVLRIGNVRLSKSHFLNTVTGRCQGNTAHAHFLSGNDDFVRPSFSEGCLEAMWYLPTNTKQEHLTELITFLNLRGDCTEHEPQTEFACRAANLVIAFVAKEQRDKYNNMFRKIKSWSRQIMFVAIREEDARTPDSEACPIKPKGEWSFVNTLQLDVLSSFISKKIAEYCKKCAQSERPKMLDNIKLCSDLGIEVDQDDKSYQDVENVLKEVVCNVRGENLCQFKQSIFALQKHWCEWIKLDKIPLAIESDKDQSLEHLREQLALEKLIKRKRQLEVGLSEPMKLFRRAVTEFFHNKESNKETLRYFMFSFQQHLKRESDKGVGPHIRNIIKLREKLQAIGNTSSTTSHLNVDARMKKERATELHLSELLKVSCQKESELYRQKNLGCEHFIRELGQYYEAIIECFDGTSTHINADDMLLPEIAAYLLCQGMALEIMDGDTGRVPITWVTHVLRDVIELLNDETIFVLGIIGVQSSGKSTLLNSMFGVNFPVRAGRCTSGIFVRVLEVEKDFFHKLGFRYIFLVDSEGLCSPERAQHEVLEQLFDNQLATFVLSITDQTILNFEGENISPNMRGILQIATYAHMRMKKAKLKTQCRITQQKVGQPDAPLRNKANLTQIMATLDSATLAASEAEGFGDLYKEFSDIFCLHLDDKTQYIPPLWNGTMVPPNHLYSEAVVTLKNAILKDFSENTLQPQFKISDFLLRIDDAWAAVKEETFVFNFQDTFKAIAFNQLSLKYAMLIVEMRLHMIKQRQTWQRLIEDLTQNLSEWHDKVTKDVTAEFRSQLESIERNLKAHIEGNPKENVLKLFHNRFLEHAKLDVKEAEIYMLFGIKKDFQEKERQIDIQNTVSEWRQKLQEKALKLKNRDVKYGVPELLSVFHEQWKQWMETVRDKFTLQKVKGNTIEYTFLEKLHKIISGMPVEKEISSLLKGENGIGVHKGDIIWDEHFPEELSGEDRNIRIKIVSEIVSQILSELKQQCQQRMKFDENLVHFTLQNALHKLSSYETESSLGDEEAALAGNTFKLPNAIVAKALLHICGEGHAILQENHQKYEQEFSCDRLFEEHMDSLRSDFIAFYESKFQDARAVSFLCTLLSRITTTHMVDILRYQSKKALLGEIKHLNKCGLLTEILYDISTGDNANNYLSFIENPNVFVESWLFKKCKSVYLQEESNKSVQRLVENKLDEWTAGILSAHKTAYSSAEAGNTEKRCSDTFLEWITVFEKELLKKTGFACHFSDLRQFHISSIKEFIDRITEFLGITLKEVVLEKLQLPTVGDTNGVENFITSVLKDPAKEVARFSIGCQKQCPLCGSPCDQLPGPFHRHAATVHYPLGIAGKSNSNSSRLAVDFCSSSLLQQNFSYRIPGKQGKHDTAKFEKEYPDWQIDPIDEIYQRNYWKWVFVKYNHEFARHYNCKPANLPKSWATISKQRALESLNYEMPIIIKRQRRIFGSNTRQSSSPLQGNESNNPKKVTGRRR